MSLIDQKLVNENYLAKAGQLIAPLKSASYSALDVFLKRKILDVGCGPGIDTCNIAKMAPQLEKIVGLDFDERMVMAANAGAEAQGLAEKVTHMKADAYEVPFEDNYFCATRSERLLMHLPDPSRALLEMVRVTKPGGKLVIIDSDWSAMSTSTGNDQLERIISTHVLQDMLPNGYSGRNLIGQFNQLQLQDISLSVHAFHSTDPIIWRLFAQMDQVDQSAVAAGLVNADDIKNWHQQIAQHHQAGLFYASINLVMAVGTIPD